MLQTRKKDGHQDVSRTDNGRGCKHRPVGIHTSLTLKVTSFAVSFLIALVESATASKLPQITPVHTRIQHLIVVKAT